MKFPISIAASAALALAACGQQQETARTDAQAVTANEAGDQVYAGTGKITAIAGDKVTIQHGPIEGIGWPAMTMGFSATPDLTRRAAVGDEVSFAFREADGTYVLTQLQKR